MLGRGNSRCSLPRTLYLSIEVKLSKNGLIYSSTTGNSTAEGQMLSWNTVW
jgi:hypothetical protein